MKQKIFKTSFLEKLEDEILENREHYANMKEKPNWVREYKTLEITDSVLDVEPFDLKIGGPELDAENSRIVFNNLKELSPYQATSNELWSYMTHVQFPDYMAVRWGKGISKGATVEQGETTNEEDDATNNKKQKDFNKLVLQRFFANRKYEKSVVRNGIARLWWGAFLVYDERRDDPLELVDVVFDKQETYEHVSERLYNSNKNILFAALETIRKYNLNSGAIRKLFVSINSYGSDKHLDGLDMEDAKVLMEELIKHIVKKD